MANYKILNTTSTKYSTEKTLVANIDGEQVDTLEKFYQELIVQLKFPESFGRKFKVNKLTEFEIGEEERIVLSLMMMILLERRKG